MPITEHSASQPVIQARNEEMRETTPAALVTAGIDPRATLEEKVKADGMTSVRYRTKPGTTLTKEEIATIAVDTKSTNSAMTVAAAVIVAAADAIPTIYSGKDSCPLAKSLVIARGWGNSEYQRLVLLWNHESQWNLYAESASSDVYGIPQLLPDSKMASAGADWYTDPIIQISWGIGYIKGRCGTPCSV